MFLKYPETVGGHPLAVVVRGDVHRRLAGTCFRGTDLRMVSNFSQWKSAHPLFRTDEARMQITSDARDAFRAQSELNSFSIDFPYSVGWSGTDELDLYTEDDLEEFKPSKRSTALRVKRDRLNLTAPRTTLVTVIYELRPEPKHNQVVVLVKSIYPGPDIGDLHGNITRREGRVFFDWNHPGETS